MGAVIEKLCSYDCSFASRNQLEDTKQDNNPRNHVSESFFTNSLYKEMSIEEIKKLAIATIKQNPLSNPFPLKFNENAELANESTIAWVKRFKLIPDEEALKKFLASKIIHLTAGAYPNCSLDKLIPISDWITFLYLNDDDVEKRNSKSLKAFNERNIEVLKDQHKLTETDEPLTHAVNDLIRRMEKIAHKNWISRFLHKVDQHFQSTLWEADYREAGIKIPDLELYKQQRLHTGAVYTVLPLIELAEQTNISESLFETHLKELSLRCNNIICWSNDIKSCPKEFEESFMNNLVFVIQQTFNCSLEEAIQRSVELHNEEVSRFEELKNQLYIQLDSENSDSELREQAEEIRKYVEGMRYWMGAHFDFAQKSARYN